MRFNSIAAKIYVSFFIFVVSLMVLFIAIHTAIKVNIAPRIYKNNEEIINKTSYRIFEDSALATVRTLASQLIVPLYKGDYYTSSILVEKLGENRNIEFAYIVDMSGVIVSDYSEDNKNIGSKLQDTFLQKLTESDDTVSSYIDNSLFCISHPVVFAEEPLGKVVIGFKADQIKYLLSKASVSNKSVFDSFYDKLSMIMLLAFFVVNILMFYVIIIFNKYVSKPLAKITEKANEVANGSYDFSLEESFDYEFQKLNDSFVTMMEEIYSREKKLILAYENIESEVRIRTRELHETKEELRKKAFYDSLTGLANRALCYDRLSMAIKRSYRSKSMMALMFLDLDNFKQVNDTLGHDQGDKLLVVVAQRLLECARETDTVCRLGGDEFVIIFADVETKDMMELIASRIINKVSEPVEIGEQTINTSTSIGITFYPDDGEEIEKLMKNADLAMYKAKSTAKGSFEFYTQEYDETISHRFYLEHRLAKAIKTKDFIPHLQPVIDSENNKVIGVEALARWYDDGKIHAPIVFLDTIEEIGLMHEMTLDIIECSLKYMKYLEAIGYCDIWLSVNISPSSLAKKSKMSEYVDLIKKYDFDKNKVVFEITENILIGDFDQVKPVLEFIKGENIQIALDDFGTGYSSLNYLNSLMPEKLKLDRSFVNNFSKEGSSNKICSSIFNLAKDMNMHIIAEGVETEEQLNLLSDMGYTYFQGYYFTKPRDRAEITEFIINTNGLPVKKKCRSREAC